MVRWRIASEGTMFSSLSVTVLDAILDLWPGAHGALASEAVRRYLDDEGTRVSDLELEAQLQKLAASKLISVQPDAAASSAHVLTITGVNGRLW
jgi:hypothetical protein